MIPISGSSTQKTNTRSLTESELFGVDDLIGFVEWASLYSKEQVKAYPFENPLKNLGRKNIVLQDNTSTIRLVKGWRRVCGLRTRSIHIKYFYAHERVDDGTMIATYCPTKEMISDYLSKPLQGSMFQTHHNNLMGITLEQETKYKIAYANEKAF